MLASDKLWRARSRLYQRQFLRPNTHFSAFFKIYKNSFAPFQICLISRNFWMIFSRIQHHSANFHGRKQLCQIFLKFCKIPEKFGEILINVCKICCEYYSLSSESLSFAARGGWGGWSVSEDRPVLQPRSSRSAGAPKFPRGRGRNESGHRSGSALLGARPPPRLARDR